MLGAFDDLAALEMDIWDSPDAGILYGVLKDLAALEMSRARRVRPVWCHQANKSCGKMRERSGGFTLI
jgi:hypothetical protein